MGIAWLRGVASATGVALAVALPQATTAESLSDAMVAAYQASNLLDQQRALLRAADEDVVQAAASLLPVVNFVASTNFSSPTSTPLASSNWTSSAQISASLVLYDNGQTRYAVDAAKESVLGLRGALKQVEQQVLLSTVQAYMEMIRAGQFVSLSTNNVRLITQELRAARERFAVGEVTRTDVSLAEARLAAARGNLAAARGDLEIARESYKAIVGKYPGNLRWPSNPPVKAKTEDAAKAFAVRNHPSIDEAQRNVNVAEANILRAKAAMGPTISANSSISDSDRSPLTFGAGLQANVPIYQGGTLRSVLRRSVAQRDAARSGLLQSVVDVRQNVGVAWANLAVASARTQASQRQVRASQVAFEGVQEEAKFGSRTTLDVLNAEQELLDARSNLISAQVQQYVSVYSLLSAMGLLTAENLGLGIPTYDPIEYYRYATSHDPLRVVSPQGRALDRVLRALKR